jgi:hypothetical protein
MVGSRGLGPESVEKEVAVELAQNESPMINDARFRLKQLS